MPRIRTIKPSFWSSRTAALVSREARLLAVGLISFADDDGRFLASNGAITGYVYPNDDDVTPAKLKRWMGELEKVGFAVFYEVEGIKYGAVNFTHQRISHPNPSTFPPPPKGKGFNE